MAIICKNVKMLSNSLRMSSLRITCCALNDANKFANHSNCHSTSHILRTPWFATPPGVRNFSTLPFKPETLEDCYKLFYLDEFCTIEELRSAFEVTTKRYSGSIEDVQEVQRAYYRILKSWSMAEQSRRVEPESKYLLNTRPGPTRKFLQYEGVGLTPSSDSQDSNNLDKEGNMLKNIIPNRERRQGLAGSSSTSVSIDTMTERLIQQHGGDSQEMIENLAGFGRPLPEEYDHPYVDSVQLKLNKIMINSDVGTEWMEIKKDMDEDLKMARLKLQSCHQTLMHRPPKEGREQIWKQAVAEFKENIKDVNRKMNNYNMAVPILSQQRMPYNAEKELIKLKEQWKEKELVKQQHDSVGSQNEDTQVSSKSPGLIDNIKSWFGKT